MDRYADLKFSSGEYVPQYAGAPLEEMQKTGDVLAGRHYQNLASLNQLQLLREQYKSKMLPGQRDYIDEQFGDIDVALQEIAKSGGEHATARVGAITNRFLGDQGVLRAMETAKGYEEFKKTRDSLTSAGFDPVWNKKLEEQYLKAKVTGETGELNPLLSQPFNLTAQKRLDYMAKQDELLAPLQPDAWESDLKVAKSVAGLSNVSDNEFLQTTTGRGLTSKKVQEYLFAPAKDPVTGKVVEGLGWTSYKDTPEYRQQKMVGMSDEEIKAELFSRGEAKVYSQISKEFIKNPIVKSDGSDLPSYPLATQAPAQALNALFEYGNDGKIISLTPGAPSLTELGEPGRKMPTKEEIKATLAKDKAPEYHPQYVADYKAMRSIMGQDPNVAPGSKEAQEAAQAYKSIVQTRISNPWVQPLSADMLTDVEKELSRQYALYEYMDPATGEVFTAFDNEGKATDKFKEVTGGDPSKFKVESVYDPKNHYTLSPGANEKFIRPIAVVSQDGDGNIKRFFTSQLPKQVPVQDINTNAIYTKVNLRPGQSIKLNDRVSARELRGEQITSAGFSAEDLRKATIPIEAVVDGETLHFSSPENLSQYLLSKGIVLPLK